MSVEKLEVSENYFQGAQHRRSLSERHYEKLLGPLSRPILYFMKRCSFI